MKSDHKGEESKLQILNFLDRGQNGEAIGHSNSINDVDAKQLKRTCLDGILT